MKRRTRNKQSQNANNPMDSSNTEMMTEQQQKMYYANKKHSHQQSTQNMNSIGNHSSQQNTHLNEDQEVGNLEFTNLNQASAEEVTQFINKLIAKNKITSKNAFDIPLIHLQQMQDYRSSLNQNTWKRLSSTLENDYKIYGYRVDATHTITYKMVESIARHQTSLDDNPFQNQKAPVQINKKQPNNQLYTSIIQQTMYSNVSKNKMNIDYGKYIQKNQKVLNVTHIEGFFSYNPGLQRTKRKFDQQGLKALLLNNIQIRNGIELRLDENRRNQQEDQTKRQPQQVNNENQINQAFENQTNQLFQRVFGQNIICQSQQNHQNQQKQTIFDTIFKLNCTDGQANKDQFTKLHKLYKTISGQDKQQKKKKKILQTQKVQINEINKIDQQQNNQRLDSNQVENKQFEQNQQSAAIEKDQIPMVLQSQNNNINIDAQSLANPQQKDIPIQQNIITNLNQQNTTKNQQDNDNPLLNKDYPLHQMNLDNLQQQSESIQQKQSNQHKGKYKNIQEYIKIKQPKVKQARKKRIQTDQMSTDQIGKRLFNRSYNKKKQDSTSKDSSSLKQDGSVTSNKIKRVNFNKINNQNSFLKRSTIFKKGVSQERAFNHIRNKIKEKLQLQRKKSTTQEEQNQNNRRKKNKKMIRVFDLPYYQFQGEDTNFLDSLEEIHNDSNQLTFSSIYKQNFPSFVFESNFLLKSLEKVRKQAQIKNKQLNPQSDMLLQNNQNITNQMNQKDGFLQQNQYQPDVSFMYDSTGKIRSRNQQVVIRQAKQKIKTILIKMLGTAKQKRNKSLNKNPIISFKQIYEIYYRQQGYISPALCFLTVLHLANEYNFKLEGRQDGSDFKIQIQKQNLMANSNHQSKSHSNMDLKNNNQIDLEKSLANDQMIIQQEHKQQNRQNDSNYSIDLQN